MSNDNDLRNRINEHYGSLSKGQRLLAAYITDHYDKVHHMEVTYGKISRSEILNNVLKADADRIQNTLEEIDAAAFEAAVDTILNARCIYIVGLRSCAMLAEFLGFYLNMMFDQVKVLKTTSASELFEQMVLR